MKKLRTKIIISIVGCSTFLAIAIGGISIFVSATAFKKESVSKLSYISTSRGNEFSNLTTKIENTVGDVSTLILSDLDVTKTKDDKYLDDFVKNYGRKILKLGVSKSEIVGLYFNFDPSFTRSNRPFDIGYIMDQKTKKPTIDLNSYNLSEYNPDNEDLTWYYGPVKAGKGVWSKPYEDAVTKVYMISYTMPVYYEKKLVGVAGADISFEYLRNLILSTKIYQSGYAFMLSTDHTFLVDKYITDPKATIESIEDGAYKELGSQISKNREGNQELYYRGQKSIISYYTLKNGLIVGVVAPLVEVNQVMWELVL